jgi:hypothetical protein
MTANNQATEIDRIVVDKEKLIETFRRKTRSRKQKTTHVLKLSPPFETEIEASKHNYQRGHRYPEMETYPIHLPAKTFIEGEAFIHKNPDPYPSNFDFPDRGCHRIEFRGSNDIEDVQEMEDEWEEYWNVVVDEWRSRIDAELVDELELVDHESDEKTTVEVEYR